MQNKISYSGNNKDAFNCNSKNAFEHKNSFNQKNAFNQRKALIWPLIVLIAFNNCAIMAQASNSAPKVAKISPPPPAMPPKVKKAPRKVTIFKPNVVFSKNPTDHELETICVLREPLLPSSAKALAGENAALANALLAYKAKSSGDDFSDLKQFVEKYPNSRWLPAVDLNLGQLELEGGYLSEALAHWAAAWEKLKNEKPIPLQNIANDALANLVHIQSNLGQKAAVETNLKCFDKRHLYGTTELKVYQAKQALACMNKYPETSYKCGPYAVNSILHVSQKTKGRSKLISEIKSTDKGTNLAQLKDWAEQSGLNYQMAKRAPGSSIIIPAVMHWKEEHFAAVTELKNGRYHLQDPTFGMGGSLWVKPDVFDKETDGYFLIPQGPLPTGWKSVSVSEGQTIWGKGVSEAAATTKTPTEPKQCMGTDCGCDGGMAKASSFLMQATLNIQDIPLSYTPPVGPAIDFLVNYNHQEDKQPTTFTFSNFGSDWSLNWISYLTVDSSSNVTVRVRGGGYELFNYGSSTTPYVPNLTSQALVSNPSSGVWNRTLPDGSVEIFNQSDTSGRIFLTQITDPQGNLVYLTYDTNFRLTTVTDAIGQASTITYVSNTSGNSGFYKIAQITDPFSRSCTFTYDSTNTFLLSITDVISLVSQFIYDTGSSFITTMVTPYGTTGFYWYGPAQGATGLRFNFSDGTSSVIENWIGYPVKTYFWDRETLLVDPNDPGAYYYGDCVTTHFMLMNDTAHTEAPIPEWILPPLENKTTYTYNGQTQDGTSDYYFVGVDNKPITVTRNIVGTTNQQWQYTYNSHGYPTQSIDPVGRTFTYTYASNNIDLTQKAQTQGTNSDLNGKWTSYSTQHLPANYIDGSGQTTGYTYNSYGELLTLTDPGSNVWTWTYDTNGYLTQKQGPLSGSNDKTTFTYDGYGRLYTITDSEGYVLTFSYDNANRITQVTYLDGTYEQTIYDKLDAVMKKDRIGRWTQYNYDSMDQLAFEIDPLGRKTQYTWCACGSVGALTDPAGNTTSFSHDIEGRLLTKTYPDSSTYTYTYDTVGRLHTRTDALSQVTTYSYNLDNTRSQAAYTSTVNPTSTVNLTYDPNYLRLSTAQNGWGTITDSYNAYVTTTYTTPVTGGGRLSGITNNVISNSAIAYTYDAIGRTTGRSINTTANSTTWTYDAMSRITGETNPLGTFGYTYVDDTSGSSKGVTRLASIAYPNSQTTNFSWYGNTGDQRLQQISNLSPTSTTLSQFNYTYDSAGEITQWQQQQNGSNIFNNIGYDLAGQLSSIQGNYGSASPPFANQYYYNYDAASNRTGVQKTLSQTARIAGTITAGDTITITVSDPGLTGGSEAVTYTVQSGDTLASMASGLAAATTTDTNLQTLGVNAVSTGPVMTIQSASKAVTTYASSLSSGATETVSLGVTLNGTENAVIAGTTTTADTLTITVHDSGLTSGQEAVTYTVGSSDTLTTIASGLATAINADTSLQGIGVTATSAATVVSVKSTSANATTYTSSTSSGATETIALSVNTNGIQTATIAGTKTTGDTVTTTIYDSGLSAGSEVVTYTVGSSDTLTTIASGLASAINADTNLQAIGVTANSVATVVNIKSVSLNNTTYTQSTSSGATETITLGLSTGIQQYTYNNLNELTAIAAGGLARFQGSTNKAVVSATINSTIPATLNWSKNFTGNAALITSVNNTTVSAVDGGGNVVTSPYKISVNTSSSTSLTHDANGNMTSNGTNTYAYDAENRLIKVTFPGTGNNTVFTYDALGHRVKEVETRAGSVTSTKQFIYSGDDIRESRDASSSIISQYFPLGQTISGANYYYIFDHLGSIVAVIDSSGNIVAQYKYGPFGEVTKVQGTLDSDFQYAGYYYHAPSGLNLTLNRAYDASLGRWINRDPIEEAGGINLYEYVNNDPVSNTDPSGNMICCSKSGGGGSGGGAGTAERITCRQRCYNTFKKCQKGCYETFPCPSPELDDCLSDCKATYFRCIDRCKRKGE